MRSIPVLIGLAGLIVFIVYGCLLVDWRQDLLTPAPEQAYAKTVLEAIALGAYTYGAFRFLKRLRTR